MTLAKLKLTELVLPTPTEFLRWVARVCLNYQKVQQDTVVSEPPRVTKAKLLVARKGLIVTSYTKDTGNG